MINQLENYVHIAESHIEDLVTKQLVGYMKHDKKSLFIPLNL